MRVSTNSNAGQREDDDQNGQRTGNEHEDDNDAEEDDLTGLLDGDDDADDDGDSGGDDGNRDGGQQQSEFMTAQQVESALDRRINAVIREVRKQRNNDDDDDDDDRGQRRRGGQKSNRSQKQTPTGPSREDVREARSTYREFVADEIRFLGNEEREFARSIAEAQISRGLNRGDDPEDVGREVAEAVASDVKRVREFYEARTVAALRRKGVLPKKSGSTQQAQQAGGGQVGGSGSDWQKGQSKAKEMFADRLNKQKQ